MEKSEIKSFTLAQLKHLMGTPESEHINDEYLVGHGEATLEIFRYPFRIDAFMIGTVCGGICKAALYKFGGKLLPARRGGFASVFKLYLVGDKRDKFRVGRLAFAGVDRVAEEGI